MIQQSWQPKQNLHANQVIFLEIDAAHMVSFVNLSEFEDNLQSNLQLNKPLIKHLHMAKIFQCTSASKSNKQVKTEDWLSATPSLTVYRGGIFGGLLFFFFQDSIYKMPITFTVMQLYSPLELANQIP